MKTILLSTAALALTSGLAFADGHAKTIRLGTEGA
jgi:polar amino acid transport system substrate-binding protein